MPLGIRSNAWAGHGKTKKTFGKGPDVGKILSFLGRFLSLNSLRGSFLHQGLSRCFNSLRKGLGFFNGVNDDTFCLINGV